MSISEARDRYRMSDIKEKEKKQRNGKKDKERKKVKNDKYFNAKFYGLTDLFPDIVVNRNSCNV